MKDRLSYSLQIFIGFVVVGTTLAGPFYECRLGSEERYHVNLCVDRCPEVGSQRGCTGNRTCCLVGCARICFHDRSKSSIIPSQLESVTVTMPPYVPTSMQHFIRQSNDIQESNLLAMPQNDTLPMNASSIINDTFIINEAGSGSAPVVNESVSEAEAKSDDLIAPVQVLGKLRFSPPFDKVITKEDEKVLQSIVKPPQQWNMVSDNVVNSLDDAQSVVASSKGSESSLMWQVFEFLRIIQSKLDVMSTNSINAGNVNAVAANSDANLRSKPPISPTDPNILVRKSLSEFAKTLNKVQSELTSLSAGQQQVVRILERVFVNQLRLANGAAALVAGSQNSNSQRQQRWQRERQPNNNVGQLAPLAEAILLDNASLLGSDSNCYRLNGCSFDVCRLTKCKKHPEATCRINSCRNCSAEFFVGNSLVQCS